MSHRYADAFGSFDGRIWMNTAHQGALPTRAADAARDAIDEKISPARLRDEDFFAVPQRLRHVIASLISAAAEDVVLGNSTTFGLDLLANGIEWEPGDEVLLVHGDFPADVFPWLVLQDRRCLEVRFVRAPGGAIDAEELKAAISPRTRLFCCTWVNSFTGTAIDLVAVGQVCRDAGVLFVLNASQALGARVLDLRSMAVDAVTCCGYKWLCGPYGTGFCWIAPELRQSLIPRHGYWLAMQAGENLDSMLDYTYRRDRGVRAWDVFCTANFLNFKPWILSIQYLLECGREAIAEYDDFLTDRLVQGIDRSRFALVSPEHGIGRSTLLVLRPLTQSAADVQSRLVSAGIDIALREGCIRLSPHLHNTEEEVERVLRVLAQG